MTAAIVLPCVLEQRYGEVFITPLCKVILRCALCPKHYRHYYAFQRHILTHFTERRDQPILLEEAQSPKSTKETEFVEVESTVEPLPIESTAAMDEKTALTCEASSDIEEDNPRSTVRKKFPCSVCGTPFATASAKQLHELRHYGIRRFACDLCDRRFFKNADLQSHKRTHTGERPYVCAHCGKGFISLTQLRLHEVRHTGQKTVSCETCGKLFYTKKDLGKHSPVHKQERKYACGQCEATFTRPAALRGHQKLHENAREYACDLCELAFNQRPALFLHRRSKHKVVSNRGFTQAQSQSSHKD